MFFFYNFFFALEFSFLNKKKISLLSLFFEYSNYENSFSILYARASKSGQCRNQSAPGMFTMKTQLCYLETQVTDEVAEVIMLKSIKLKKRPVSHQIH